MENITSFLENALDHVDRSMTYRISVRLSELFPDMTVLGCRSSFDIEGFVRYAHGEADLTSRLAHEVTAELDESRSEIQRWLLTSWIEVTWRGERFQVLRVLQAQCGFHHWIVGPDAAIDEFMKAVIRFSNPREVRTYLYSGWWQEAERYDRAIRDARWDDLILPEGLLAALEEHALGFFEAEQGYERVGIAWKRGILLTGPPGNGKTLAVRALLGRIPAPRLIVKSFGDDADDVEEVFAKVAELAPCVLVCEDIDSIIKPGLLSCVLNQIDGVQQLSGVLILATTNHPEKLDPAFRNRPSRFDRVIEFGPPGFDERRAMLRRIFQRCPREARPTAVQYRRLADATDGFSYAYMKELAVSTLMLWNRERLPGATYAIAITQIDELRNQIELATESKTEGEEAETKA